MLPGYTSFLGAGKSLDFTFVNYNSELNQSTNISALGRIAGDLILTFSGGADLANISDVRLTPGFTSLISQYITNDGMGAIMSAKISNGTETSVLGVEGDRGCRVAVLILRPSIPITGFSFFSGNSYLGDGNPPSQTITTASASASPTLAIGHMNAVEGSTTIVRSISPTMIENSVISRLFVHYLLQNGGPSITYDMNDTGRYNIVQSGYLTFTF